MEQKFTPIVIGICSPSGGGKTALVHKLAELLEDSVVIHFDDYGDPFWDIPDLEKWIQQGADLNQITTPQLASDLDNLRNKKRIISPIHQQIIEPRKFILFDTLVGRAQRTTGKYIDYLVYINTPFEVALSRRIMRGLTDIQTENLDINAAREFMDNLYEYLQAYSSQTGPRQIYQAIQNQVMNYSDLVLNGEKSIHSLATEVISALNYDSKGSTLSN